MRFGNGHRQDPGLEQGSPEGRVESDGFGGPYLVGKGRPTKEPGEGNDQIPLLLAQREVHERGTLPRLHPQAESLVPG